MAARPSRATSFSLSVIVASVVLGFLLTVQFRSTAARIPTREQGRLVTAEAMRRLEDEQRQLKERIGELRAQIADLQHTTDTGTPAGAVAADLDSLRLATGLVALHGPGVIVTLDDSTKPMGASDDANNFLIHDYELRDVVNALWLAGAEAISINGERLVTVSSLYCVGSTILVNDTRLSPPYEVRAIGDQAALEQAMQNPGNLAPFRSKVRLYGVQFRVTAHKDVTVPAYMGNLGVRYAQPTNKVIDQFQKLTPGGF